MIVLLERDLKLPVSLALLPSLIELFGRSRNPILEALSRSTLFGAGKRCQKVGSGLLFGTFESHVDKVLFGVSSRSKVDLVSVIKDDDLGEVL